MKLYIPKNYHSVLSLKETERAIKMVKDFFEQNLAAELKLRRVTAPLFVERGTGINDDLNGIERPVTFQVKDMENTTAEIVHSLAKWKRMMLADYEIADGYGLYTDMNALRPDEELDNIHSIYVDQWDWEKIILPEQRKLEQLKAIVRQIYGVIKRTEFVVYESHPDIRPILPEEIHFIHAEELLDRYPGLDPHEREHEIAREYGAVFIIGIGGDLGKGQAHDGRAPDYDDWSTPTQKDFKGLNGDIVVWNPILETAFELSSMGIRVDREAMLRQLRLRGQEERSKLLFHKRLLEGEYPESIGGGIGQSRLCMYFLRKAHIGEVQASLWPDRMKRECREAGILIM
ncbi:MAG: aspartate--ammonia ligase [Bacteroidetes bacterium]|nr:MAG: aspartate--ammonia ligase [Bacteroidota bacterium]